MAEEGFFHGLGPWPNINIEMGLLAFYPPHLLLLTNSLQNRITLLLILKLFQSTKLIPRIHFFKPKK